MITKKTAPFSKCVKGSPYMVGSVCQLIQFQKHRTLLGESRVNSVLAWITSWTLISLHVQQLVNLWDPFCLPAVKLGYSFSSCLHGINGTRPQCNSVVQHKIVHLINLSCYLGNKHVTPTLSEISKLYMPTTSLSQTVYTEIFSAKCEKFDWRKRSRESFAKYEHFHRWKFQHSDYCTSSR